MDLFSLPPLVQVLFAIVAIVTFFFLYSTWTHRTFEKLGIPGPKPGLFGSLKLIKDKGVLEADNYLIKTYGKVVGAYFGREPFLLIADPEMMKQICIKDFSNFTNRKIFFPISKLMRRGLVFAESEHWKFVRSVITPTFSSGKMRYMTPLVQTALDRMVVSIQDKMKRNNKLDASELFEAFTMNVIGSTGFGMDIDSQNNPDNPFVVRAKDVVVPSTRVRLLIAIASILPFLTPLFNFLDIGNLSTESRSFFQGVTDSIISGRSEEKSKRQDLVQLMLNARLKDRLEKDEDEDESTRLHYNPQTQERGLSREEIVSNSIIFIVAGYATTATTLTFAAYFLATNPDCQEKLHDEVVRHLGKEKPTYDSVWKLQYLDCFISETLRMYPPAPRTVRACSDDIVVKGIKIPKGMNVQFAINYIHHDPETWPEPDKFDPDRFLPENKAGRHPCAWVPFGAGPRTCLGMRLALLELKMVLATIVQHFRVVTCDETKVPLELDKKAQLTKIAHDVIVRLVERE